MCHAQSSGYRGGVLAGGGLADGLPLICVSGGVQSAAGTVLTHNPTKNPHPRLALSCSILRFRACDVLFPPLNSSEVIQPAPCQFNTLRQFSGAGSPLIFCHRSRTIRLQVVQQLFQFVNQKRAVDASQVRAHGFLGVGNGSPLNQAVRTSCNWDLGKTMP